MCHPQNRFTRQANDLGCKLVSKCPYKTTVCAVGPRGEDRKYENRCFFLFDQCLLQTSKYNLLPCINIRLKFKIMLTNFFYNFRTGYC